MSCKHLCRIELLTEEPDENYGTASWLGHILMLRPLFDRHPRSRVWHEERNRTLPNWLLRPGVLAPALSADPPPVASAAVTGSDVRSTLLRRPRP